MNNLFSYDDQSFGGTEYVAKYFHENIIHLLPKLNNYNCILMPGNSNIRIGSLANSNKDSIVWLNNHLEDFGDDLKYTITHPKILKRIIFFIVPTNYVKKYLIENYNIEESKIIVINYGFDSVNNKTDKFLNIEKTKIIYTVNPDRGLDILLNSLKYINQDFELDIYNNFYPDIILNFPKDFNDDNRITFHGKTPRKTVLRKLSQSHIFVNPSIVKETFCLSQVEALSAGCLVVYNDYGSLSEVSLGYGIKYSGSDNFEQHSKIFAENLNNAINFLKTNKFNSLEQSTQIDDTFSWNNFEKSWKKFHDEKL